MTDALSATFAALADPTRRAILSQLSAGEATVSQLAAPHEMSLPAISRHLRVLEAAGLISQAREAQWRPRRLETAELKRADDWLSAYREFFDERLDRLDGHLKTMVAERDRLRTTTKGRSNDADDRH
ncbi:ArsR/SmtB family transcription factor [Leifsonia sp. NPDC058292]|uniref:ArsR/SmtB family transcription factor n=1 Tax=Leifsonia sp. NPDC058292 TaxID=3346428 RepID=UPI0036DA5913